MYDLLISVGDYFLMQDTLMKLIRVRNLSNGALPLAGKRANKDISDTAITNRCLQLATLSVLRFQLRAGASDF